MTCPHYQPSVVSRRKRVIPLGYKTPCCRSCQRIFNEHTVTPFNDLQFPTDIMLTGFLCRLRRRIVFPYGAELNLQHGFEISHETVRVWELGFSPIISERLRTKRRGAVGRSLVPERDLYQGCGRWCRLYRAIDRDGNLLHCMLSQHSDRAAAQRFLDRLIGTQGCKPLRATTGKHPAYGEKVRWIAGRKALHRSIQYLNNRIEQHHRLIKRRYHPMLGFVSFESVSRFSTAFDELRSYLRGTNGIGKEQ